MRFPKAIDRSSSGPHASKFSTSIRIGRGGTIDFLVPRVDFSATPDLAFRVETPIVFADPDTPGNDGESGIGDLLFRGSFRVAHGTGYAIVAGGEVILNSASKDSLGMGKNVIAPLVFASIDVPQCNSVVFPFVQHYMSVGGDNLPQVYDWKLEVGVRFFLK